MAYWSDSSLWAGVPVLTTPGVRHAARVAASSAAQFPGVPHMAALTLEEYVTQGVALGRRRRRTDRLKRAIQLQRVDSPLFDTQRWVRDWERLLAVVGHIRGHRARRGRRRRRRVGPAAAPPNCPPPGPHTLTKSFETLQTRELFARRSQTFPWL